MIVTHAYYFQTSDEVKEVSLYRTFLPLFSKLMLSMILFGLTIPLIVSLLLTSYHVFMICIDLCTFVVAALTTIWVEEDGTESKLTDLRLPRYSTLCEVCMYNT